MSTAALSGLKVLDFSRVLAGPYCSMLLADFGADVIKIESLEGDDTRQWGPPWLEGESAYYLCANRNKRSLAIDIKQPRGLEIARRLADRSDVVIENFRVGTMARMGLGYEALSATNPALIYCSISGYGQTGPLNTQPGYDFVIQAEAGIMSITGPVDSEPYKVGVAVVDVTAGLFASHAILAALHHRESSGTGQYIDVALFDSQLAWLVNVAQNYLVTGNQPARMGNAHPNIVPYEIFQTMDGYLAIAVGTDRQYKALCEAVSRDDLWGDARFQTNAGRVLHRQELISILSAVIQKRNNADWLEILKIAGIPVGKVNDIPTALQNPQVQARQMVQDIPGEDRKPIRLIGPVAKLSKTPAKISKAPPRLGEDTYQILEQELGFSPSEIAALFREKVIA